MKKEQQMAGALQRISVCGLMLGLVLVMSACSGTKSTSGKGVPPPAAAAVPMNPQTGQPMAATTVLVKGRVTNPVVPWTANMTLAEAIVAAGYRDQFSPHVILLIRRGQIYRIDPQRLLSGRDNPLLEPGDAIDLQQ